MSTSTEQIAALNAPLERRFYPRIAPSAPISIASGEKNQGVLLNVSENGLLVSTPIALKLNFASRISIPLNGLPKAIQVHARVIWTNESTKCAGIQMLDLSEHDREQIRKWGALESAQSSQQEVNRPRAAAEAPVTPPAPMPTVQSSMEACLIAPTLPARVARKRSTSALLDTLWGFLIGTLCVGAVVFFRDVAPRSLSTGSAGNPNGSVVVPTMEDNPVSPPQTSDSSSSRVSENGISGYRPSPALATSQVVTHKERDSGSETVRWLWAEVARGKISSEIVLADMYVHGDRVPKNCAQARVLLSAAAKKGSKIAVRELIDLDSEGGECSNSASQ
jgi:hypothetical protein